MIEITSARGKFQVDFINSEEILMKEPLVIVACAKASNLHSTLCKGIGMRSF